MSNCRLTELYDKASKHSQYQVLASPIRSVMDGALGNVRSRWEEERLHFMLSRLSFDGATIADVGGNTGYFTLELVDRGVCKALYIEGNKAHSEFVREAVSLLGWNDRVDVVSRYLGFEEDQDRFEVDVCLLLNVLHHVGDDYGAGVRSVSQAKDAILDSLRQLAGMARYLVFQLGYNWKGDIRHPLFENGEKKELIDFIRYGVDEYWDIESIGVAQRLSGGRVVYTEVGPRNIGRDDRLGEFLNRPLFIMRSKKRGPLSVA